LSVTAVRYRAGSFGVGELWLDGDRVLEHELPAAREGDDAHPLADRLRAYFGGEDVRFDDVALELDWCTPFQRAVVDVLRALPRGELVTYGELAALAGHPGAQRAAGTFCARNRFPIFVPCHRVVAADGLGSYGSLGTGYKRRLLALEGVDVPL
jgi:methylated-DNA-[protein]-cysteine S-methyltransferase